MQTQDSSPFEMAITTCPYCGRKFSNADAVFWHLVEDGCPTVGHRISGFDAEELLERIERGGSADEWGNLSPNRKVDAGEF